MLSKKIRHKKTTTVMYQYRKIREFPHYSSDFFGVCVCECARALVDSTRFKNKQNLTFQVESRDVLIDNLQDFFFGFASY